ncbi:putative MAM and LDL-receptor class A domain-containing protein 1 [Apostichopus japonicus]|uniref:Putative MAM and LDL-receptor class A domain-containing protein 1 n=1 Tax=Stichopus japonicus TaxID=307972 RepID=A0A2G8KAY8_STIJA|nr:putative MAM and LDL-receptor class A domain-containing protein 1 [Apostichopus japonicus]
MAACCLGRFFNAFNLALFSFYLQLKLWFYLWGDDAGTLTVYYRDDYAGPITPIFTYGQSRNYDFWQSVETELPWSGKGQLIFEATGATGPDGSVAIDDISMIGDCTYSAVGIPGTPTTVVPPTGSTPQPECLKEWYICPKDPDICVTPGQICNFYNNCPSGEDESACADCEYDNGDFCGAMDVVGWVEVPAGFYPQYPVLDGNRLPLGRCKECNHLIVIRVIRVTAARSYLVLALAFTVIT